MWCNVWRLIFFIIPVALKEQPTALQNFFWLLIKINIFRIFRNIIKYECERSISRFPPICYTSCFVKAPKNKKPITIWFKNIYSFFAVGWYLYADIIKYEKTNQSRCLPLRSYYQKSHPSNWLKPYSRHRGLLYTRRSPRFLINKRISFFHLRKSVSGLYQNYPKPHLRAGLNRVFSISIELVDAYFICSPRLWRRPRRWKGMWDKKLMYHTDPICHSFFQIACSCIDLFNYIWQIGKMVIYDVLWWSGNWPLLATIKLLAFKYK